MERGETQGVGALGRRRSRRRCHNGSWQNQKLIAQFGVSKSREFPDGRSWVDLADARRSPCCSRAPNKAGPGVPVDRVAALRRAFDAPMHDAGFVADAAKIGLTPDPMTGEQVQALEPRACEDIIW
jgi:hypothetical protein